MIPRSRPTLLPSLPQDLPAPGTVDVWFWDGKLPAQAVAGLARTVSAKERAIADRYRDPVLRDRYLASHAMLFAVLACTLDQPAAAIAYGYGQSGKPCILAPHSARHIQFNMAHSAAMNAVAVSAGASVGIDVERMRSDIAVDELATVSLSEGELAAFALIPEQDRAAAFLTCWTRKEALLKAQGTGLTQPLKEVEVGFGRFDPHCEVRPRDAGRRWTVSAIDLGAEYLAAVAVEGSAVHVRTRRWNPIQNCP